MGLGALLTGVAATKASDEEGRNQAVTKEFLVHYRDLSRY